MSDKQKLDSGLGKVLNYLILFLIMLSIILFTLESMPSFKKYSELFALSDRVFLIIFSLEYFVRVWTAKKKLRFIFSFYGLVDALAIIPGILTVGVIDLRVLRSLRFIRVFRILRLVRFTKAIDRLNDAFGKIKEELVVFAFLTSIILYLSAAGIYYFENPVQPEKFISIPHSLWWAVSTLTTVGYGDIYPITVGGKIFTVLILFLGLGVVAIPSALLANALSKREGL